VDEKTCYTPDKKSKIDLMLAVCINTRQQVKPLQVKFEKKTSLEDGAYIFGTVTVLIKIAPCFIRIKNAGSRLAY
jgi:hypothetical protein